MKNQVRGPGRTAGVFIVPRRANLQLAIMTGARRGALCALSWNHFDLTPGVSVGPLHPRHRDRPRRSVRLEVAPDGSPGARATLERDVEQVAMISPAAVPAPPARRGGRRGPGSGCIGTSR
jgi:integrase